MPINVNVLQSTYAHKCKCVTKYLRPQMHMCYKIPTPTNTSTKWTTATEPCPSHLDLLNHTNGKPRGHESKGQAHHQRGREGSVVNLGRLLLGRAGCRWWWSATLLPSSGWLLSERWGWPAGSEWLCRCTALCSFQGCWSVQKKGSTTLRILVCVCVCACVCVCKCLCACVCVCVCVCVWVQACLHACAWERNYVNLSKDQTWPWQANTYFYCSWEWGRGGGGGRGGRIGRKFLLQAKERKLSTYWCICSQKISAKEVWGHVRQIDWTRCVQVHAVHTPHLGHNVTGNCIICTSHQKYKHNYRHSGTYQLSCKLTGSSGMARGKTATVTFLKYISFKDKCSDLLKQLRQKSKWRDG